MTEILSKLFRLARPLSRDNGQLLDQYLSEQLKSSLEELRREAWRTDAAGLTNALYRRLARLQKMRTALASLTSQRKSEKHQRFTYLISASFLQSAFRALTKTSDEDLMYASGPDDDDHLCAITKLVSFELAQRSAAHAAPEAISQRRALMQLDENKEKLLATLHSHPGTGAHGTRPSGTDLSTQLGLEQNGYPAIGGIFSRDGYVRFYSVNRPFRVVVSGAGVEQVGESLFRLADERIRALRTKSLLSRRAQ